jgi:hypothetical protein
MDGSKSVHGYSMLITKTTKTILSTTPDSSQTPNSLQEAAKTHPIVSRVTPLPSSSPRLPLLPILPSVPIHLPLLHVDSRASAPVNPPLGSVDVNPRPIHPLPLPPEPLVSSIPYVVRSRGKAAILGMFPDDKAGGTRGAFPKDLEPPADLCRSLVMEILPRKFRTHSFVLDWLSQFSFRPSRYEFVEGKVFFEFEDQQEANIAWNSPRMGGIEGLQGVRLFWYRKVPPPALQPLDITEEDNATRTIGGQTQPQPHFVSDSPTDMSCNGHTESQVAPSQSQNPVYSPVSLPLPPPTTLNEFGPQDPGVVAPQVEDITPNPNNQKSLAALTSELYSGDRSVPSPTSTTTSSLVPTPSSDCPDNQMAAYYNARRNGPPGGAFGFSRASTLSPTLVSIPLSPAPASASASSTSPPLFPALSPRQLNSCFPPTILGHQVPPITQNQGLMQASRLATPTSHSGTKVTDPEFNMLDRARTPTPDLMETVDDEPLAKEAALRHLVLQSRKRKVAPAPVSQQPTQRTTSTAISKNTLEELAANFIADAIARPPPAKRMKTTPSPSALAEWGKVLEAHIKTSKLIMVQLQAAQSQAEKVRLRTLLQEKNRCVIRQQKLVSAYSG